MSNKNQIVKKVIGIIQEIYSVLIVIYCIYHILLAFINGSQHWNAENYFLFICNVIFIIINIILFILGELISKPKTECADSSYINKRDGIKKEVFILILNCIFFLLALAVFLVRTWGLSSFLPYFLFCLIFTPLLIIVILTSNSLKLRFKSENRTKGNQDEA